MSRTPDFFEDLRRVGILKRDGLGGRPSDNALSKAPRPPVVRGTVGAWLRGEQCPQQVEPLLAVLQEIRAEAARQGRLEDLAGTGSDEAVADLLAEGGWAARTQPVSGVLTGLVRLAGRRAGPPCRAAVGTSAVEWPELRISGAGRPRPTAAVPGADG